MHLLLCSSQFDHHARDDDDAFFTFAKNVLSKEAVWDGQIRVWLRAVHWALKHRSHDGQKTKSRAITTTASCWKNEKHRPKKGVYKTVYQ